MTSASATSARNCPICGSRNSGLSLFCAECGAALNGSPETDTTAFKTTRPDHDEQRTQSFVPESSNPSDSGRWQAPKETPSLTAPPAQRTGAYPWSPSSSSSSASERAETAWLSSTGAAAVQPVGEDEGIRGFILGFLAIVLIAALLGLYLWAGVFSENTRDTVVGWFDFIGR